MAPRLVIGFLVLVLLAPAVGCGAGRAENLLISWAFADGRSCADAGVQMIAVRRGDAARASDSPTCSEGFSPSSYTLFGVPASEAALHLTALSREGSILYRGDVSFDLLPPAASVVLYANLAR